MSRSGSTPVLILGVCHIEWFIDAWPVVSASGTKSINDTVLLSWYRVAGAESSLMNPESEACCIHVGKLAARKSYPSKV